MEESFIYGFLCRYREQLDKENVSIRKNEIKLEELKKIVTLYLQTEIKELDLCNFAWCLIFDDTFIYESKNSRTINDLLFDIDSLSECTDQQNKALLLQGIKQKLNISMSEL